MNLFLVLFKVTFARNYAREFRKNVEKYSRPPKDPWVVSFRNPKPCGANSVFSKIVRNTVTKKPQLQCINLSVAATEYCSFYRV